MFPARELSRAANPWCAAPTAVTEPLDPPGDALVADMGQLRTMKDSGRALRDLCPGLVPAAGAIRAHLRSIRSANPGDRTEAAVEGLALCALGGPPSFRDRVRSLLREMDATTLRALHGYSPLATVPIWPRAERASADRGAAPDAQEPGQGPQGPALPGRMTKERKDQDQTNCHHSFILHRSGGILSWAESLNIDRMTDDDTDENAAMIAEDQDWIFLYQQ